MENEKMTLDPNKPIHELLLDPERRIASLETTANASLSEQVTLYRYYETVKHLKIMGASYLFERRMERAYMVFRRIKYFIETELVRYPNYEFFDSEGKREAEKSLKDVNTLVASLRAAMLNAYTLQADYFRFEEAQRVLRLEKPEEYAEKLEENRKKSDELFKIGAHASERIGMQMGSVPKLEVTPDDNHAKDYPPRNVATTEVVHKESAQNTRRSSTVSGESGIPSLENTTADDTVVSVEDKDREMYRGFTHVQEFGDSLAHLLAPIAVKRAVPGLDDGETSEPPAKRQCMTGTPESVPGQSTAQSAFNRVAWNADPLPADFRMPQLPPPSDQQGSSTQPIQLTHEELMNSFAQVTSHPSITTFDVAVLNLINQQASASKMLEEHLQKHLEFMNAGMIRPTPILGTGMMAGSSSDMMGNSGRIDTSELRHDTPSQTDISKFVIAFPSDSVKKFLAAVQENTIRNIETCGVFVGHVINSQIGDRYHTTHLIIPRQIGTATTCRTTNNDEIMQMVASLNSIILGWIHVHPEQGAYLSTRDMHTQYEYQFINKDAFAVVVAPERNCYAAYKLTDLGMTTIGNCVEIDDSPTHSHPETYDILFTAADQLCFSRTCNIQIVDIRNGLQS